MAYFDNRTTEEIKKAIAQDASKVAYSGASENASAVVEKEKDFWKQNAKRAYEKK